MADLTLDPSFDDQKLLAVIIDYYHRALKESKEAVAYLRQRGITNNKAVTHFKIGYADRSLGTKCPARGSAIGDKLRDHLASLGLLRPTGHEHFSGCITFPIYSTDGSRVILDIYGRKILGEKLRKGTPFHMHLPDAKGVWNLEAFNVSKEIILLPSLWDALTFWSHGYRNVTCCFSTDTLPNDHLTAFKEFQTQRVLTPCDALADKLVALGLECFLLLPIRTGRQCLRSASR